MFVVYVGGGKGFFWKCLRVSTFERGREWLLWFFISSLVCICVGVLGLQDGSFIEMCVRGRVGGSRWLCGFESMDWRYCKEHRTCRTFISGKSSGGHVLPDGNRNEVVTP